ncbi:LysR family transcriptional regulator [Pseudovibrio brasiliensis]|uniref:LysR family transcriptional regulator n=1 Tax=Pseudovibrio brasiliensis TaxID=1898042 RepID=A0ABX8ANB4_9HYPH|nr:LysR family transcriptional regulator [Pseudovibrio brasiliensis]QUS55757.1 LysR family transcriptional regulator [Pseudovibrio brasiliensis]
MKDELKHIRRLAIFACVVEQGSFAAAGRKLNMGRAKVSEQVALLEEALGVRVLQRSTRKLSLTTDGERLLQHSQGLLQLSKDALASVEQGADELSGTLRVTCTQDFMQRVLKRFLSGFLRRYPALQLELLLDDHALDLIEDEVDVAIRIGIPADSAMIGRVLCDVEFQLYASRDYLSEHGRPALMSDLKDHRGIDTLDVALNSLSLTDQAGLRRPISMQSMCRTNSPSGILSLVEIGAGIGLMPLSVVRDGLERGEIERVLPDWSFGAAKLYLLYPSKKQLARRSRVFMDEFRKWLLETKEGRSFFFTG